MNTDYFRECVACGCICQDHPPELSPCDCSDCDGCACEGVREELLQHADEFGWQYLPRAWRAL
jgi:hypothetical protein